MAACVCQSEVSRGRCLFAESLLPLLEGLPSSLWSGSAQGPCGTRTGPCSSPLPGSLCSPDGQPLLLPGLLPDWTGAEALKMTSVDDLMHQDVRRDFHNWQSLGAVMTKKQANEKN